MSVRLLAVWLTLFVPFSRPAAVANELASPAAKFWWDAAIEAIGQIESGDRLDEALYELGVVRFATGRMSGATEEVYRITDRRQRCESHIRIAEHFFLDGNQGDCEKHLDLAEKPVAGRRSHRELIRARLEFCEAPED